MSTAKRGTLVFVHGAFSDADVWTKALLPVAHEGYRIHAAHLPLESFANDVAALNRLIDHAEGSILLVGHSYAGAVISAAGSHEKVKALAYVTAYAPEPGEVFGSISGMFPAKVPFDLQPDASGYLWITTEFAASALGHDLHPGYINLMVAAQKPTHASVFGQTLTDPAWKHKPSSYLITTEDRVLAPETQQTLARRIGARHIQEVAASHMVPLSNPEAVTDFIRKSAEMLQG